MSPAPKSPEACRRGLNAKLVRADKLEVGDLVYWRDARRVLARVAPIRRIEPAQNGRKVRIYGEGQRAPRAFDAETYTWRLHP